MKFIVDNQLPVALAEYLRKGGFDCQHVLEAGLGDALDSEICRHAELQGRIIISKDEDFFYLANPQVTFRCLPFAVVILVRRPSTPTGSSF